MLLKFCKIVRTQKLKIANRGGNGEKSLPDSNAVEVDKNEAVPSEKIEKNCLIFFSSLYQFSSDKICIGNAINQTVQPPQMNHMRVVAIAFNRPKLDKITFRRLKPLE